MQQQIHTLYILYIYIQLTTRVRKNLIRALGGGGWGKVSRSIGSTRAGGEDNYNYHVVLKQEQQQKLRQHLYHRAAWRGQSVVQLDSQSVSGWWGHGELREGGSSISPY